METLVGVLKLFPSGYAQALLMNAGLLTLVYWLVWKKFAPRLRAWRIQTKQRFNDVQLRRELKNALFTLSVGALFSSLVIYSSTQGYTKIYTDFWEHPYWSIGCFFVLLFIDDTWFYWIHRLLHHPKLYRLVHEEHHKSVDVNPFTTLSFHVAEPFLLSLWIIPVAFFFPVYAPALGLLQLWGFLDNLKSHLGYELYPRWWNRSWLGFLTSSTYHNLHHSHFNGNYGVHFRFWDRLLGTEFPQYETTYEAIKARHLNSPFASTDPNSD
jgi:sterol desaturase/sphingolipid hydroxylase (fatty acid hydroxylase superfamily)